MSTSTRLSVLVVLLLFPLVVLFAAVPPIPQDPAYHIFADRRLCLGIPNFFNVASNLAFLAIGAAGLMLCASGRVAGAVRAWTWFFAGTALVAAGSAYYHLNPNNTTLVWDRLPMAIAFMALFSAAISEHVDLRLETPLLWTTIPLALASIAWWHYTDDLRLYVWVQFGPIVGLIFLLAAFPGTFTHRAWLAYGAVLYGVAKAFEAVDAQVFDVTRVLSGHTLKHLVAALAPVCIYVMLRSRSNAAAAPRVAHA